MGSGFSYAQTLLSQIEPPKIEFGTGNPSAFEYLLQQFDFMRTPQGLVKLTGSVKAATKYIKSFHKELDIRMHCVSKEHKGARLKAEMQKYIQLVPGVSILRYISISMLIKSPILVDFI